MNANHLALLMLLGTAAALSSDDEEASFDAAADEDASEDFGRRLRRGGGRRPRPRPNKKDKAATPRVWGIPGTDPWDDPWDPSSWNLPYCSSGVVCNNNCLTW
ncbi:hypothetical protein ACHAXT_000366 [Thalassiosira profunda]